MKNILLTGISRGLGLITAKILLENEFNVFGISRAESHELHLLKELYTNRLKTIKYDLSDNGNLKTQIFSKFIPIDIPIHGYINNAAIAYDDLVTNVKYETLKKSFDINVFTPVIITKYVIRNMLFNKIHGSIVHLSSISVHTGYKGLSMYASSKGAIEAFSKNISREWGIKKIRSNCVIAGFMESDMSSSLTTEEKKRIYNRTCLKGAVSMKSVAEMIVFLLSDKACSVTGQNIFVDNGTI
jgi:3-oxoacyl-[acyl-carrier protein] reductase